MFQKISKYKFNFLTIIIYVYCDHQRTVSEDQELFVKLLESFVQKGTFNNY